MNNENLKNELINKFENTKKSSNKKTKILTDNDIMKYEIASELGLMDKVSEQGWAGLTAKEAGKIGGMLTSRKKQKKKMMEEANKDDGTV
ncbi:MAG: small, acid-soluble spore protein, alpha/beta type [Peptostreptococcaceae bacterium]